MAVPGMAILRTFVVRIIICLAVCMGALSALSAQAVDHTQLAVIINTRDPLSVQIGEYYAAQRRIPFQNIIKVSFTPIEATLTRAASGSFASVKRVLPRRPSLWAIRCEAAPRMWPVER